jgi:hypothetical protein
VGTAGVGRRARPCELAPALARVVHRQVRVRESGHVLALVADNHPSQQEQKKDKNEKRRPP